ncbi:MULTISPECIES: sensor histidine kinase [Delftia]|uniref:histidine kinase n=1 Tax=Delftia lacustris TaxID=558537 RepID=A0A1H3U633_9BURK|nr:MULTISPECIES: sensor histidine kinase [Delftia]EPD37928.1 hypothetical protein HMPREF9701_03998 [Delftia acidovorans CCUG 274B]PZP61753.1 MAG: sensor histidine kinase [Delftia acidovorans]SDZ57933.1 Histidine kinase-, DNA gyrase B-, and HSP90-like ATPase [Delftia lacustris]
MPIKNATAELRKKIKRKLVKHTFVLTFFIGAVAAISLAFFALTDSMHSARLSEKQVRQSSIEAELSNFLYSVKENSLLENPAAFSPELRSLNFITLQSSFYTYLLNRGNARDLTAEKIVWDAPRSCIVEYSDSSTPSDVSKELKLQACFAMINDDVRGRYAYFSLKYPTPTIARHRSGNVLNRSDRVILTIDAEKPLVFTLVFEPPTLAASRYPSQLQRFAGIHEVSAFLASNNEKATRAINAQAFERLSGDSSKINYVTIVGRIDAAFLDGISAAGQDWPSPTIGRFNIGAKIYSGASEGQVRELFSVTPGEKGTALVSLERTYLSTVSRGAKLDLFHKNGNSVERVWSSSELNLPVPARQESWIQTVFDKWARVTSLAGPNSQDPVISEKTHLIGGPYGTYSATLVADPVALPEVVTRAFGWLTAAILLMALLLAAGIHAGIRLFLLGKNAWNIAGQKREFIYSQSPYKGRKDEISRLGHILFFQFNRIAQQHKKIKQAIEAEAAAKARNVLLMETKLELRQDTLDAIGHEIRSPLQTILNKVDEGSDLYAAILRMQNGIDKLYLAASVEDGIGGQEVICSQEDLADFLFNYVENKSSIIERIKYLGPESNVITYMDPIMFELVLDHVIDNALRYRYHSGQIKISLISSENGVIVEVFNNGPIISSDLLPRLFKVGVSDKSTQKNHGLGLYASRVYLFKMKATISVENATNGVVVRMVFGKISDI